MPRTLTPLGQNMLRRYPPILRQSHEVQAFVDATSREIARIEAGMDELAANAFPGRATGVGLERWEALLELSAEGKTVPQRQAAAERRYRWLIKDASGPAWVERITDLVGPAWVYADEDPRGWRGLWVNPAESVPSSGWTYVDGSSADLAAVDGHWEVLGDFELRNDQENNPNQQVIIRFEAGTDLATAQLAVHPKVLSNGDLVECYVHNGLVGIRSRISGTFTILDTSAAVLSTGTTYWLVGNIEGDDVVAEVWDTNPMKMEGAAIATASATLTGGDATALGLDIPGYVGWRAEDVPADWPIDTLRAYEIGFDLPAYTIRVTIPYAADSARAYEVEQTLRALTPANLDIQVFYEAGFILGVSQLGQEGLI